MYSWEIDEELRKRNYILTPKEYLEIIDFDLSPQICRIVYDIYTHTVHISTTDNYNWTFRLENLE